MSGKTLQLWFGILFTAIVPIVVGLVFKEYQVAWLSALCGAFITIMAKPEGLTELSLGPLKAKMQETIAEAAATVEQLREVATTMATVVLSGLMAGQFMWGMSFAKRLELHDELIGNLRRIGASDDQLNRAQAEWWKGVGVMYHNRLGRDLRDLAKQAGMDGLKTNSVAEEFNALAQKATRSAGTPAEHEEFFLKHGLLNDEIREWISDYKHFLSTKEIRRNDFHD
jgi:hypothetical protein